MIEPLFARLAEEKGPKTVGGPGVGFAKIDIGVGMGHTLASEWGIRATPTFIFYLDGKKVRVVVFVLRALFVNGRLDGYYGGCQCS